MCWIFSEIDQILFIVVILLLLCVCTYFHVSDKTATIVVGTTRAGCRACAELLKLFSMPMRLIYKFRDDMTPLGLGFLPYHHLIQEHVPLLSEEEALLDPFHLVHCQWTCLISGYSAAAVSHQLATTIAIAIAITLAITSGKTTVAA
jgi:hypothetical protein